MEKVTENTITIGSEDMDPFLRQKTRTTIRSQVCGEIKLHYGDVYSCTNQHSIVEKPVPFGLENLGNSCYMNSILQALANIPELRKILKLCSPHLKSNDNTYFLRSLHEFFCSYKKKDKNETKLKLLQIKSLVGLRYQNFKENDKECAVEFLEAVLEILEDQANKLASHENFIHKMFSFKVETSCSSECQQNSSSSTDKMMILNLKIPSHFPG